MNIVFLDGSGRKESYNRKLLTAFECILGGIGLEFTPTYFSISSHPVPNLIPGVSILPEAEKRCNDLRAAALQAQAFVIASPEYNGGPTGGLKNLIDWMAQPNRAHPTGNPFVMKPLVLLSASPGSLGGIKGLQVMRLIMGHLRALVLPEQVALPYCNKAFDDSDNLTPGLAADLAQQAAHQLKDILSHPLANS